jgi:uncharacterized membrane protein (DUF106 family)
MQSNIGGADLWASTGGILGLIIFALLTLLSIVIIFSFFKLSTAITGLTTSFNDRRLADSENMATVQKELALLRQQVYDNKLSAQTERHDMAVMIKEGFNDVGKATTKILIETVAHNKNK